MSQGSRPSTLGKWIGFATALMSALAGGAVWSVLVLRSGYELTLFAFVIVCAAVLIMRRTHPEAERPFRAPWVPVVPILGIATCLLLMFSLPAENWWRLIIWMGVGFVIYFGYSYKRSLLGAHLRQEASATGGGNRKR